jgi:hypothetical protein
MTFRSLSLSLSVEKGMKIFILSDDIILCNYPLRASA